MDYSQSERIIALESPLGPDVLLLQGLSGQEGISELFSFDLDLLAEDPSIIFTDIVGQRVNIRVKLNNGGERHFNGFVSRFTQSGQDERFTCYQATMVPWLWFLTRTADCRIFQGKSAPDIIEQIFGDLGFSDFKRSLSSSYEPLDYCVQYRETDFNFVSRLMEQYGMFYFFEHERGKHTLVLADAPSAHQPCPDQAKARCAIAELNVEEEDVISDCQVEQELRPGKFAHTDYNFETPKTSLMASVNTNVDVGGNGKYEIYDYPGEYGVKSKGEDLAKLRMEEEEATHFLLAGSSTCRAFTTGYRFDLAGHYRKDLNQAYVLLTVHHSANSGEHYVSGGTSTEGEMYSNQFTCIPHKTPYRAARVTPKPVVQGVQTAVIVGKSGEEIWTDKYGRVKVQFPWDREGKQNENSSCWVRISNPWAGKAWGGISLPRIGQEVIVDFLEGDPDRPIITGRVYNADQPVPYELPANQTQSGIKSRSSKGGGAANFNEIRMEDKKGSEELYVHAEKDKNTVVENDKDLLVGNDKSESVGRNKTIQVGAEHNEKIDGGMTVMVGTNLTESVAINYSETVGAAMEVTVGGLMAVSVGAAMTEAVGLAKTESVGAAKSESIGTSKSLEVGSNLNETIKKDRIVDVSNDLTESIGGQHKESVKKDYVLQAKKIQLVADDEINLKTGKAELIMKKNGDIMLKGKKINVKGTGDVIIKGSKIKEN